MHKELLEDIGEKELIKRLAKFMPKNQVKDDCAVIESKKNNLLITNDVLVENVHFNDETISPKDLGWKSVASNISDLLSSGSKKTVGITVGLIIPRKTEWNWIKELYLGIREALDHFGGVIIGGDCAVGTEKVISITAFGLQGDLKLRRDASKPGEIILTTGLHGLSKLGLLINSKKNFEDILLTRSLKNQALKHFCRPKLKQNFYKKLLKARPDQRSRKVGCTDSSDGLFQAIQDLALSSRCKAIIDYKKIPKHKDWPEGNEWDKYYFFGGEDYQLIFSLPKDWAKNCLRIDKSFKEIGYFAKGVPSVEIKNIQNIDFLNSNPFKHF